MAIETVKGFRDVLPPESLKRRKIRQVIEEQFSLYGFLPIETPTIEYDELLKGDNEQDQSVSDRFRLQDRGGRNLGLRYEFTFQLSRIIKENPMLKMPFKRYQIGYVFRDEALKSGKSREFIQCDADIVGDESINADAECLALASSIMSKLNIGADIFVNNRKLLNAIAKEAGIDEKDTLQAFREIDKLDKLPEDEVKANLTKLIGTDNTNKIFLLLKKDLNYFLKNKFEGANEIKQLEDIGISYGFKIKFKPALMRGFSYYTGNVWEIWATGIGMSLAGGGRFDDKVGKYAGRKIPAVGISFGKLLDWPDIEAEGVKVVFISIGKDEESIRWVQELRNQDISCSIFFGKISKALEYANSYSIPYAIFLGEEESKRKKLKLRDMKTGKEQMLSLKTLIGKLK